MSETSPMLSAKAMKAFRISKGRKFKLADHAPEETCGFDVEKDDAKALLDDGIKQLTKLQERLFAEKHWALLVIFQAMDAAGKDGAIKHVMSGVNPQGCEVTAFKAPSHTELAHDFLRRAALALPPRGHIGIFNRSYYEEVLVVRVHPGLLERQPLPESLKGKHIWRERYDDICAYESYLARNGTVPVKFFLNVSKEEQRRRFLERIDDPDKRWKFELGDIAERKRWDDYMDAYEDMIRHTSTPEAPWYVVPADNKWFARLVVSAILVERLEELDVKFPELDTDAVRELKKVRKALVEE